MEVCIPGWHDLKPQLLLGIPLVEDSRLSHREGIGEVAHSDPEWPAEVDVRRVDLRVDHTPLLYVVKTLSHERHEDVFAFQGCGIRPASTRNIPCKSNRNSTQTAHTPSREVGSGAVKGDVRRTETLSNNSWVDPLPQARHLNQLLAKHSGVQSG
jgi:hypothetical protein